MKARPILPLLALAVLAAGCGTSDDQTPRPIEVLYYVSGGPGVRFQFAIEPDDIRCGSNTTGIQSVNANHQFGDREFFTPHLFVLENDRQPVRAAIENIPCPPDEPTCIEAPLRVDMYLGLTPQQSNVIIQPGECRTVSQPGVFPAPTPPLGRPTPTAVTFPAPSGAGPETRIEVCSPQPTPPIGLTTPCLDNPPDRNIAYFASLGDIVASNITNCLLPPILDACRSPATFFVEQPQDQVAAIMSVNPNQNPPGLPTAEVRVELYLDDTQVDSSAGTNPIVSADL